MHANLEYIRSKNDLPALGAMIGWPSINRAANEMLTKVDMM